MDARTLSIKTIFGQDRRHDVPLYQRPYVWNREDQLGPLWEDLKALAEKIEKGQTPRAHFLGAIVLDQVRQPTGAVEKRQVIDGQQRLTTIQVFAEAFCDWCVTNAPEKFHKALWKLTRNDDPMASEHDDVFKIWPTNTDREQFRTIMDAGSPDELRQHFKQQGWRIADSKMADAYLFFSEKIAEWGGALPDQSEKRVEALFCALRDFVRMVVIDLDRDDDPQLIFETLNARGTPLLPSDLVKNYLFHRARVEKHDPDQLYASYWSGFDTKGEYWREAVGRGHARRARIDLFLQYFLTLKSRDEVPVSHLYTGFKEYASSSERTVVGVLKSVRKYADIFWGFDNSARTGRVGLFFQRLGQMDIGTAYPFLLELFAKFDADSPEVMAVTRDLESYLVRRLYCRLSTRGYNTVFGELARLLADDVQDAPMRIRSYLSESQADFSRWPDDREFHSAWISTPVYADLVRGRVRMILEALELQMRTEMCERVQLQEVLTIEHVLPQTWRPNWPLDAASGQEETVLLRERLLHTIGNLTLLTKKLNPSVSNGSWPDKRRGIRDHTVLRLNVDIVASETWDEETITSRAETLFASAIKLWPGPAGA